MKEEEKPWSVWLVRSESGTDVEEWAGGPIDAPYARSVVGVYATKDETQHYRSDQVDGWYGFVRVAPLHDEPIAWLIQQPDDCCPPYVSVSRGGPVRKPYEDDVLAVYRTKEEADAHIAEGQRRAAEERARTPDWRTLPDNCAYCGHPRIWHTQAYGMGCIWEDDIDDDGNWTMCLKQCLQYIAPKQ